MCSAILITARVLICGAVVQERPKVIYKSSTLFWAWISLHMLNIPRYILRRHAERHCAKTNATHT